MSETVIIIAGGIVLLVIGLGLGFWAAQLRIGKQAAKAADVQEQFDDYRRNVTAHFGRTAEHFQAIGEQYRELYEHMASGADTLIDPQTMDEKLSFVPRDVIEPSADDEKTDEVETAPPEPTETPVEEVESAPQGNEDSDELERIYH